MDNYGGCYVLLRNIAQSADITLGVKGARSAQDFRETYRMTMERALTRFMTKCLTEAFHLGADSLIFAQEGSALVTRILKNKVEVSTSKGEGAWFDPISHWLANRFFPLSDNLPFDLVTGAVLGESTEFKVELALREFGRLASAQVKRHTTLKGVRTCSLTRIEFVPLPSYSKRYGTTGENAFAVDEILQGGAGVIVVMSPSDESLKRLIASVLPYVDPVRVIPLEGSNATAVVEGVTEGELVVLSTTGMDPVAGLITARQRLNGSSAADLFRGVFCGAVVSRVCESCGRDAQIDSAILKDLPVCLKAIPVSRYVVGRGCDACSNTGYRGFCGLHSVVLTPWLGSISGGRVDHGALVSDVLNHGGRSLLEDGIQKAFSGYTTIEAVVSVVRTLPPGWETAYEKRAENPLIKGDPLPDPFSSTTEAPAVVLERGSGVFRQPSSEVQGQKRQRPLILVAEDDGDQRDILEMVIKGAQYDVISAKDGADALAKIQKELPDLIITDLMMPRMDGRELVAHVKANPRLNKIPVMVLTVVSDVEKEYALLNCGAEEYCEKTVQRRILLKRVENLLKRHAGKGAAV